MSKNDLKGRQKELQVSGRFELSGVRVTKGKITDSKCMKEIQGKSIALYVSGKLFTYRFPKPKFCPKGDVSVDVGLGEG